MWLPTKWIINLNIRMIKQIISTIQTPEVGFLALFLGEMMITLTPLIILVYMITSGRIKAVQFSIEDPEEKEVIEENKGGEEE